MRKNGNLRRYPVAKLHSHSGGVITRVLHLPLGIFPDQLVRAKPVEVQETGPVTPAYVAQAKQPESKPMAAETTTSTVKEIKSSGKRNG